MRILLSVVFLCLCISAQAQKKNQIQIGIPAAYFFDDTPYRFYNLKRSWPIPTHISYARAITSKNSLRISFDDFWLVYDIAAQDNYRGEVLLRGYSKVSIEFQRRIKKIDRLTISGKAGLGYRFGSESFHETYGYTDEGVIWETIILSNLYRDFSPIIGLQAEYRLFGQLSAVAQVNFLRYFSKYSPNELHNVFGLSYGF